MNGRDLARMREKCGLTQDQLAQYLGIGRTSIWRMETKNEPVGRAVEVAAQTLDVTSPSFQKWVDGLELKPRVMVRRRQAKYRAMEIASKRK